MRYAQLTREGLPGRITVIPGDTLTLNDVLHRVLAIEEDHMVIEKDGKTYSVHEGVGLMMPCTCCFLDLKVVEKE